MATEVGVETPDLEVDPYTGNGTLTATMHTPDGATTPLGSVPMTAGQIALAKQLIPAAAAQLQTNLTAQGGVAENSDVAAIFSFVLAILKMDASATPTHYAGPDVLVSVS